MKKITLISMMTFLLMSFSVPSKNPVKQSKVHWKAYKVASFHEGFVKLKKGWINIDADKVTGGEFVMDMTTINATDLTGEWKQKLETHLSSEDFFSVGKHKEAKLSFKSVTPKEGNTYKVIANLEIKGISKQIEFDLIRKGNDFSADLKINRLNYEMQYNSGSFFENLGDKLIKDEFDVSVEFSI